MAEETATPGESWPLLDDLATPAVVADDRGRIVFLNARAEAFWGLRSSEATGRPARDVLGILPRDSGSPEAWVAAMVRPALDSGEPVPALVVGRDGVAHRVAVTGFWEARGAGRYALLTFRELGVQPDAREAQAGPRDPATGLRGFHARTAEYRASDSRGGAVLLFDLDALRDINALHGLPTGDAVLAAAGRALAAEAPPGAVAARHGDDELVLVLGNADLDAAEALADRVVERVARDLQAADPPVRARLHCGVAPFAPGALATALKQAKDRLYQKKGVLLQARTGGRVVLTKEGRAALQEPGGERKAAAPGAFAASFSPEFDRYFRQAYARSVEQARDFVAFAGPEAGSAVVEVGAGSGRITFDGGLAERVGPEGQLLVSDPSPAQLQVARTRADELGLGWVRFVCAAVEALPMAPGTADLCLGSTFLHFTEPPEAIRAMARVVRTGGRVAVSALLDIAWPSAWEEILAPIRRALQANGLALSLFAARSTLEAAFEEAGLSIDRIEEASETVDYGSADVALAVWRQTRFVPLMLRRLQRGAADGVEEAFEARLRSVWEASAPGDLSLRVSVANMAAHR